MPTNPFDALKQARPQGPQVPGVVQDAAAEAQTQSQPPQAWWKQAADRGIAGGVGMVKGALGIDDGSQGFSPNHLTQMAGAGMGLLPEGILASLRGLAPAAKTAAPAMLGADAAQAASRSASDLFNPAVMHNMENMYHEAHPAFEGLQNAGAFGGDRSVGGIHQLGTSQHPGLPEFAAVGDEGLYNGMTAQVKPQDAKASAVAQLLKQGGQLR